MHENKSVLVPVGNDAKSSWNQTLKRPTGTFNRKRKSSYTQKYEDEETAMEIWKVENGNQ